MQKAITIKKIGKWAILLNTRVPTNCSRKAIKNCSRKAISIKIKHFMRDGAEYNQNTTFHLKLHVATLTWIMCSLDTKFCRMTGIAYISLIRKNRKSSEWLFFTVHISNLWNCMHQLKIAFEQGSFALLWNITLTTYLFHIFT